MSEKLGQGSQEKGEAEVSDCGSESSILHGLGLCGWSPVPLFSQGGVYAGLPAVTGHTEDFLTPSQASLECSHHTCDSARTAGCPNTALHLDENII